MTVMTKHIELSTRGNAEIVDITPDIEQALKISGLSDGVLISHGYE